MEKCSIAKTLNKCDPTYFPGIYCILKITALFPIMSCKCERSISALRIVKTYLRSTMGQGRLASLALTYAYPNVNINSTDIALEFSRRKPRLILSPIFLLRFTCWVFLISHMATFFTTLGSSPNIQDLYSLQQRSVLAVCMTFIIQLNLFLIATLIT